MNSAARNTKTGKTLADVRDHYIKSGDEDARRAVDKTSKPYNGCPLELIPADLREFEKRFPLKQGFDPRHWKTEKAYKAWRRKVIAGIKHVTGAFASKALRGNRQDGWTPIELVLKQVAKREPCPIPRQQLIPVGILIDEARKNNVDPLGLDGTTVALLTDNCLVQNRRRSVEIGLRRLNDWRAWPELRTLLPAHPIPDPIVVRRLRNSIPNHLSVEITRWVETATRNVFDEISQTYIDQYDADTINRYLAALRKFVSTAGTTGTDLGRTAYLENLMTADVFHAVARSWIEDHQNGERGALSKGSIAAYSQILALIFERNGKDASFVRKGMKTNPVLKAGRKQHDTIAPKNRAFCESLLDIPGAETEFLQQHIILRAKADEILQRAKAAGRDLSGPELTAVSQLGTTSMFCALEAAVLPARIGNALDTRLHGCGAHFQLPNGKQESGRVAYSAEEVKNGNPMDGLFERDQRQGLQTLEWYLEKIRPLFPMSKASPFLFPSIRSAEKPLSAKVMTEWLKIHTRIAGRPITAHNYRHGMATILYARGNLDIKHIADYLGINPRCCSATMPGSTNAGSGKTSPARSSTRSCREGAQHERAPDP